MKDNQSKACMALVLDAIISICQNNCAPRMNLEELLTMVKNVWTQDKKAASEKTAPTH